MILKILIAITISTILVSCDCSIKVVGKVVSTETGIPIYGAKIEMLGRNLYSISDKNGNFSITEQTGFCYEPNLKVSFEDYKPFELKIFYNSNNTTYEVLKDTRSVNLSEPIYPDPKNEKTFITATLIEHNSKSFKIKSDSLIIYLDQINPSEFYNNK